MLGHVAADCRKDLDGLRVGPIVDDVHEQITICLGHFVTEETAAHDTELLPFFGRHLRDNVPLVEEDTLSVGRLLQDGTQQVTATTSNVGNRCELGEVVCGQYRG